MFRRRLDVAVKNVKRKLSKEKIEGLIADYRTVVDEYLYNEPDVTYAPLTPSEYEQISGNLPNLVDFYYGKYQESLEKPLPFYIGTPVQNAEKITFGWDEAYDFQQDDIKYEVRLSDDLSFGPAVLRRHFRRGSIFWRSLLLMRTATDRVPLTITTVIWASTIQCFVSTLIKKEILQDL